MQGHSLTADARGVRDRTRRPTPAAPRVDGKLSIRTMLDPSRSTAVAENPSDTATARGLWPLKSSVRDAMEHSKLGGHKPLPDRLFSSYEQLPATRFVILRAWERWSEHADRKRLKHVQAFVAEDMSPALGWKRPAQVVLTCVSKTSVTPAQVDHTRQLLQLLPRRLGFQSLVGVFDSDSSWVFVQEFDPTALWLSDVFLQATFSEDKLRKIVFQLAAMLHFLHAHRLSLAGQLYLHDLVQTSATKKVILLLSPCLVFSGCTLVLATKRNKDTDIAALGMLMFQLCVLPHSPLAVTFDREEVVSAFASQLDHVSPACRDVIFETIDSQVTIEVLMRKRWLRGVDFFPAGSRMEPHAGNTQSRELMRSSLIWKLAAFLLADWLRDPNKDSKSLNAQPVNEEETGETRRRKVGKRAGNYVARRPTSHHSGVGGPLWLRRGMVVIPPLGMSITPSFAHDESDGETVSEAIASWDQAMAVPIAHHSTCSTLEPDYDEFTPYESLDSVSLPKYDTFDEGDEAQSGVDDYGLPFLDRRSSLTAIHENENDSMSDFILQREILRSLQQAGASSANWSNGAVSSTKDEQVRPSKPNSSFEILSTAATRTSLGDIGSDAVHFSAFGPNDVGFRTTFRLDIWAYLREQRNVMLEVALEMNDNECGKRVQPFYVQRGALVTISIEPSEHFAVLGEDCKSFRWRGAVTGVSFDISRKLSAMDAVDNDSACIARIVAGSKVSLLYIRMRTRSTAMTKSYMNLLETEVESVLPDMKEIALEDLEVVRQIGSGSFGDAMLARWKANGQDNKYVVVKSLRSDVLGSSESAAEFRHEATVMHMLGKHPHVVELLGICPNSSPAHTRDSSSMYLVTEYMPNGSLHDVLGPSSKHVSESFSVFARTIMARDAAHGLVNIHQGHYLHRDIAARNCLVDDNFRVKVCDFGLSRRINSSGFYFDDDRHGFGPLKWMAPESILPPHLFSTQSDSYMFGVLMFEIFSGSVPFPSLSTREAIALILEGQHVPIPAHLPVTHQSLMRQCFESHPMARPSLDQIYVTLDQWVLQDTKAETQVPRWDNWRRNVL